MPFDTLFLTLYSGKISPDCVGPVFPSLDVIQDKFDPISHTEKLLTQDGEFTMMLLKRKSRTELQKYWKMYTILQKEGVEGLEKYMKM